MARLSGYKLSVTHMNNVWFIIPARKESKGIPFKNRMLLQHTLDIIPKDYIKNTIVTSDDETIIKRSIDFGCKVRKRDKSLAGDTASSRDSLLDVVDYMNIADDDIIVLLYLTYPTRKFSDVEMILSFFIEREANSLLCRTRLTDHPFLCFYEDDNFKGSPIVEHDLCSRQQYPSCFSLSHYVGIFRASSLINLGRNLYNKSTLFFPIDTPIDIDEKDEAEKWMLEAGRGE